MKLTIEQLAEKVNKQLSNLSSTDKRFSSNVSVRRIRDYMSKGVLDKPFKEGKSIYFTDLHYQKLIALREVQSEGISEENIKKIMHYENRNSEENTLKHDVLTTISAIMNASEEKNLLKKVPTGSVASNSQEKSINYLNSIMDNANLNKGTETKLYISKAITKSWSEIPLLTNNKVFFRIENNTNFSKEEKIEILHNIKQILGIKGEEND